MQETVRQVTRARMQVRMREVSHVLHQEGWYDDSPGVRAMKKLLLM